MITQDAFVIIEGSQAGVLTSPQLGPKKHSFDPPLQIMCSEEDSLTFYFCTDQRSYQEGISILKC